MKILLIVCLCAIMIYAVCPNNCGGHGKCEANGVCSCYKKSDGFEYDYVGNDCSKRGCAVGDSLVAPTSASKYSDRKNDDSNIEYRRELEEVRNLSSVRSDLVILSNVESTSTANIYEVSITGEFKMDGKAIDFKDEIGGIIDCFSPSDHSFVIQSEIVGYADSKYYLKGDDKLIVGLECSLIMTYTDFSLFNPTHPTKSSNDKEWNVEWINTGFTTAVTALNGKGNGLKMACVVKETTILTSSLTIAIDSGNNKITFTLTFTTDPGDISTHYCHLLANKAGDTESQKDYERVYSPTKLPSAKSNMYGISEKHNNIYTVPSADIIKTYTAGSFGVLNCNIPGKYDIQTAYLLGDDKGVDPPTNYYILYDFDVVDINGKIIDNPIPILYNCELTQYSDFSMYFPVKVGDSSKCTAGNNCPITWDNMCSEFKSYLPTSETPVKFACRNDSNLVELYNYTIPKGDACSGEVVFTSAITDASNLPTGKICYLIARKDASSNKAVLIDISVSELYNKYLTKKSSETVWNYYKSLPIATATLSNSNIYKVNGLNIISFSTGGIMKCGKNNNGKIEVITGDIDLLYKNGNDYYVHTTTNIAGNDCGLLYPHTDMTLYPSEKVTDKTVTFTGMSYYFQLLGFYKSIQGKYTMLCGSDTIDSIGVKFTEYEFTITSATTVTYYESTSANVVFSTKNDVTANMICFLLSSFDGKKIVDVEASDLKNKYDIKKGENTDWTLTLKSSTPTPTVGSAIAGDIYPVTGVQYEGITSAGGLLECRNTINNKPLGLAKIYYYDANTTPTYNIKYYFVTGPTPEYYNCSVIESYKDLTLYLPPQTYVDGTGVKWTNMKDIFSKIYTDYTNKKDVKMLCENGDGGKYKMYDGTADSTTDNDIVFTITDNTPTPNNKKCFLMANTDSTAITTLDAIQKSDLGKLYEVKQGETSDVDFILKLKTPTPTATEKPEKSGIYELSNVNYDIGNELSCLTYDAKEVSTGLILNKKGDKYLMSFEKEKDLSILKCMIINKYNDLSNYVTCTITSQPSNICETGKANNALYYMGLRAGTYTFQCGTDGDKSTSYTSSYEFKENEVAEVKFTLSEAITGDCYLLSYFNGKELPIESSDVKSSHFIGVPSNAVYIYHSETKPNEDPVEIPDDDISIIGEIGLIGANIQCKNEDNGEYMGTAVYLGKDEAGNNIINSENLKQGSKYVCEVNEVINDFSLIKSEIVDENSCTREYCVIIIKKLKSVLSDFNIFKRFLADKKIYDASCIKGNEVGIYQFELDSEFDDPSSPDAVFKLSESDTNANLPIGMECSLLATADGKPVEIEETQIGTKLYKRDDGSYSTASCTPENGKLFCENKTDSTITLGSDGKDCLNKIMNVSNVLLIPSEDVNTTLIEKYLKAGRWIKVGGNDVQIFKVEKKLKELNCDTGKEYDNGRLLFESRNLQPTMKGYKVTISQTIKDVSSIEIIPKSLSAIRYNLGVKIECSNNGKCNRETGICECFDGFTGVACQRLDCPNNCNGNGRCVPLSELLSNEDLKYYNSEDDNGKIYGCLCDKRHRGYDCSLIECPSDKDPEGSTNDKSKEGSEYRDCSGRGICNYNTGVCECFDGFSGEGCQTQTQMM